MPQSTFFNPLDFARNFARTVRDRAVVPVIDAGLKSGLIEPQIGMFGRYLTGTSQPMNYLPPSVSADIRGQLPNYRKDTPNWRGPSDFDVTHRMGPRGDEGTAYQPWVPKTLQNTLGQFSVQPGPQGQPTVRDRYAFQNLTDATEGGGAAKQIIRAAQQLGVLRKDFGSGYEINAPLQ